MAHVRVRTVLTDVESAQLDLWLAGHADDVQVVEIERSSVSVQGAHPSMKALATATATRQPGRLGEALDDALHRLRTEGGGS